MGKKGQCLLVDWGLGQIVFTIYCVMCVKDTDADPRYASIGLTWPPTHLPLHLMLISDVAV